jgi:hypothetical protein
MKSATQKLSKADRDTSVGDLRHAGLTPGQVIGRAMHASGFSAASDPLDRESAQRIIADRYDSAIGRPHAADTRRRTGSEK